MSSEIRTFPNFEGLSRDQSEMFDLMESASKVYPNQVKEIHQKIAFIARFNFE
jgi:hypothetical protein